MPIYVTKKLLERLREIVDYFSLNQKTEIKFIRFYDDDFFAAPGRKVDCLRQIKNILKDHFQLYELQASIRSIRKDNMEELIRAISEFGVRRITIGVDGYNNEDLLFLHKGYSMEHVFETIAALSEKDIPCLLYAILTTNITTCSSLNETFLNMIRLVLLGQVYIGPSITSVISVASNNKKLYPYFTGEQFCFLKVDSVSDILKEGDDPENVVMRADLLPKDRVVRAFIQKHDKITMMQSAYILPLVADFYQFLALEYNWLYYVKNHREEAQIELENEYYKLRQYKKKYKEMLYFGTECQTTIENINNLNDINRKLMDCLDKEKIINDEGLVHEKMQVIQSIILEYVQLFNIYFDQQNANIILSELSSCLRRLLAIPILAFDAVVVCPEDLKIAYQHILKADFVLDEEEEELFKICKGGS